VRDTMIVDTDFTHYKLGPSKDEARFRGCISQALPIVGAQLEALDNFRRLTGGPPIEELPAYVARVEAWQKLQPGRIDALERARKAVTK